MGLSKTEFLTTILLFYTIFSVLMGLWGGTFGDDISTIDGGEVNENSFGFVPNVVDGYSSLPVWLNIILFGTLGVSLTFIIVTSLPTFNGGS